ncbi:hypothetical protein C9374_001841 [Naegleria lovaniensis]|uniref:Uncharacterized protein n=1 Tax=Naegleria lovaniensis TaxID=51637 RepID=A0AA88GR02_NAELO|nr:uncharacterized protein C9374_001841 [Naegleria lovaniensis]KAG2386806.1 hypothetical protein C9374_001841 [Naegleria lovaniensis]
MIPPQTHSIISTAPKNDMEMDVHSQEIDDSSARKRKMETANSNHTSEQHHDEETPINTMEPKTKKKTLSNTTNVSSSFRINDSHVPMDASASSSYDTTTNVGQFHRASSMKILSFHNYKKWIAHEVASLLCMKKLDGGASLAVEKARTLYNAGFDGTSLANIVQDIRKHNDKHALEKLLNKAKDNTGMINPCLSDTCTTIVNWVNNTLIPKLFGLWDSALCKQKLIGGAGLLEDRVQPLYQAGFNGTFLLRIIYELEKNEQNGSALTDVDLVNKTLRMEIDSSTCTALMEWVKADLVAKNKIQIPLVFIEQPSINELPFGFLDDPFTWLETFLSVDLKQCFETKLEQRYEPPSGTMKGFYNRDDFKFKVKQLVKANITHFHKNKIAAIDRKNSFKYGIMSNGTGNGKTRACNEVQNIIMDMDINEIGDKNNNGLHYRKLHTYMTLDNGSYLTSVEVESDPLKEITEGKIIGLRILAKSTCIGE